MIAGAVDLEVSILGLQSIANDLLGNALPLRCTTTEPRGLGAKVHTSSTNVLVGAKPRHRDDAEGCESDDEDEVSCSTCTSESE